MLCAMGFSSTILNMKIILVVTNSNRPEILGTLYSKGLGTPNPEPSASNRGLQIAQQFYPFAKKILNQP